MEYVCTLPSGIYWYIVILKYKFHFCIQTSNTRLNNYYVYNTPNTRLIIFITETTVQKIWNVLLVKQSQSTEWCNNIFSFPSLPRFLSEGGMILTVMTHTKVVMMRDLIFHVLNYLHQAQGLQKDAQMHESHPIWVRLPRTVVTVVVLCPVHIHQVVA